MMGLRPGLYQITFEWQPGHIKMAAALMDYSSLCLTALRLLADATQQSIFKKRCKEGLYVWVLGFSRGLKHHTFAPKHCLQQGASLIFGFSKRRHTRSDIASRQQ